MIDSVSGVAPLKAVDAVKRAQEEARGRGDSASKPPTDTVKISEEAQKLAQAEKAASNVRSALEANPRVSLGLDPNFDTKI